MRFKVKIRVGTMGLVLHTDSILLRCFHDLNVAVMEGCGARRCSNAYASKISELFICEIIMMYKELFRWL